MKRICLVALIILFIMVLPVNGISTFSIISVNPTTIHPCEITDLKISLKNCGANSTYYVAATLVSNSPIKIIGAHTIKVPNTFGYLKPNDEFKVCYRIYVNRSVKAGVYPLYLTVTWTDGIHSDRTYQQTFIVGVNVQNPPRNAEIKIISVNTTPNPLIPGNVGYITMKIENIGYTTARSVDVCLIARDPFVTLNSSLEKFIDKIEPNSIVYLTFKVGINWNVSYGKIYYSLPVIIKYQDEFGKYVKNTSIGVSIRGMPNIELEDIVLEPTVLTPNTQGTLTITVMNSGTAPARDVRIYIYGADYMSAENYKYLGTILPGQTQTVVFGIYIPQTMETGSYGLSIVVSYRDNWNKTYTSRNLYEIVVYPPTPFIPIQYVILFIGAMVVVVVVYVAVKREIIRRGGAS